MPHWYAVASVKWLQRIEVLTEPYAGEFQTGHYIYEWPDREHERVTLMRVRARITDPAPGATIAAGEYTIRGKAWSGTGPVTDVHVSFTGEGDWHAGQGRAPERARTTGRTGRSTGRRPTSADTPSAPEQPTRPATSNPTSHPGTGSATETTQSRSPTSTCADVRCAVCR